MFENFLLVAAIDWPKTIIGSLVLTAIATFCNLIMNAGRAGASRSSASQTLMGMRAAGEAMETRLHTAVRRVMILTMTADGQLDDSEMQSIRNLYRQLTRTELTKDEIASEAARIQASGTSMRDTVRDVAPHLTADGKGLLIKAALIVAASDGVLKGEEQKRMVELAQAMDMPPEHFNSVVASVIHVA
jgi:tellurite resistance protein